jgi:hypothetical protein
VDRSHHDGRSVFFIARGAIDRKRQSGRSSDRAQLRSRGIRGKAFSRRAGHTETMGRRAAGLHRGRPRDHGAALISLNADLSENWFALNDDWQEKR